MVDQDMTSFLLVGVNKFLDFLSRSVFKNTEIGNLYQTVFG